jgi:hypothetical protein
MHARDGTRFSNTYSCCTPPPLLSFVRITASNQALVNARQTLAATEDVAVAVSAELLRNRDTLMHASANVSAVDELTNSVRRVLRRIAHGSTKTKVNPSFSPAQKC